MNTIGTQFPKEEDFGLKEVSSDPDLIKDVPFNDAFDNRPQNGPLKNNKLPRKRFRRPGGSGGPGGPGGPGPRRPNGPRPPFIGRRPNFGKKRRRIPIRNLPRRRMDNG